ARRAIRIKPRPDGFEGGAPERGGLAWSASTFAARRDVPSAWTPRARGHHPGLYSHRPPGAKPENEDQNRASGRNPRRRLPPAVAAGGVALVGPVVVATGGIADRVTRHVAVVAGIAVAGVVGAVRAVGAVVRAGVYPPVGTDADGAAVVLDAAVTDVG